MRLLDSTQRVQKLQALNISNLNLRVNDCVFVNDSVLESTKPDKHLTDIQIQALADDKSCRWNVYSVIRGLSTQLLLSYQKPHRTVSTDTIARSIRVVLSEAGIRTSVFSAHFIRAASTSAAYQKSPVQITPSPAATGTKKHVYLP